MHEQIIIILCCRDLFAKIDELKHSKKNGDTIDYHLAQIHTKMKRIYLLLSLLTGCLYMQAAIYNVRDFGAKADGKAIDSPAINRAIEAAAQEGGGTVYLPARRICLLFYPAEK